MVTYIVSVSIVFTPAPPFVPFAAGLARTSVASNPRRIAICCFHAAVPKGHDRLT